jgi:hypothetical protein
MSIQCEQIPRWVIEKIWPQIKIWDDSTIFSIEKVEEITCAAITLAESKSYDDYEIYELIYIPYDDYREPDVLSYCFRIHDSGAIFSNDIMEAKKILDYNPWYIQYLRNVTQEINDYAVTLNGLTLKVIKNPSYDTIKKALEENGEAFKYIMSEIPELHELATKAGSPRS